MRRNTPFLDLGEVNLIAESLEVNAKRLQVEALRGSSAAFEHNQIRAVACVKLAARFKRIMK